MKAKAKKGKKEVVVTVDRWSANIQCFSDFIKSQGRLPKEGELISEVGTSVSNWFTVQKAFFRQGKMSENKVTAMEEVLPSWSSYNLGDTVK